MRPETRLVHEGRPSEGPLSAPLELAANFRTYGYAREDGTGTWRALESAVGALEGGESVAFSSGMAAISAVLEPLPVGARVVGPAVGYTGVRMLLAERAAAGRIELEEVDVTDTDATLRACEGAALLWAESPTNPLIGVAELDRLSRERTRPAPRSSSTPPSPRRCCCGRWSSAPTSPSTARPSSSAATPTSCSASPPRAPRSASPRSATRARRWARRREASRRSWRCAACARWRSGSSAARRPRPSWPSASPPTRRSAAVHYPGLPDDPGHDRAARLMDGFGAMLAFEVAAGAEAAQAVAERVRVIVHATSLGGVETLIERRARYEYEATPEALLRLSVGVEHVEDLWADLRAALGPDERLALRRGCGVPRRSSGTVLFP